MEELKDSETFMYRQMRKQIQMFRASNYIAVFFCGKKNEPPQSCWCGQC